MKKRVLASDEIDKTALAASVRSGDGNEIIFIDGKIYVYSSKMLEMGNVYEASIIDCDAFNLVGRID